jgi:hypothetical protein
MIRQRKFMLLAIAVLLVAGVAVWWQQGGFGGPVSDGAARRYFARVVDAAMAKDFDGLCRLNGSVGTCEFELNYICRNPDTGGPLHQTKGELERNCPLSVPSEPPEIVASRHEPRGGDSTGGRILVVRGVDGWGDPYETEVLIFRDKRSYRAIHAVFWTGDKFDELKAQGGGLESTPSSR